MYGLTGISLVATKTAIEGICHIASEEVRRSYPTSQVASVTFFSVIILTAELAVKILFYRSLPIMDAVVVFGSWVGHRYTNDETYVQSIRTVTETYKEQSQKLTESLESDRENLEKFQQANGIFTVLNQEVGVQTKHMELFLKKQTNNRRQRDKWLEQIQELQKEQKQIQETSTEILKGLTARLEDLQTKENEVKRQFAAFTQKCEEIGA